MGLLQRRAQVAPLCFLLPLLRSRLLKLRADIYTHAAQRPMLPFSSGVVAYLAACPAEVPSAEAVVGQFRAAATKPTSLSLPLFVPSSTSAPASDSNPAASNSRAGSSTATTPASSSAPASTTPSNAAAAHRIRPLGLPLGGVAASLAGVLLGAALLR
ncbi:hypothetical protein FB451DRAFT_1418883 [Mycena latifolia]|nr:hypothetical protein FB451DRAFT_1418883 [Mycena latifolia]